MPNDPFAPDEKPAARAPAAPATQPEPDLLADARREVRSAGYCVLCDAIVERTAVGSCAQGHPARAIAGQILLGEEGQLPVLPRFNLAAFLIPPIWGPAHGQWVGALFLPIWLFADNAIVAAVRNGGALWIPGALILAGTLAFEFFFARKANGVAFRRVMHKTTAEEFAARQRTWALASIPAAAALIGWGLYFDIVLGSTLRR